MSKSTTSEKQFQQAVVEMAKLHRWLVFHPYDSRRSAPGFPDLTMVRDGGLIFAELKTDIASPTEDQKLWLDELSKVRRKSGGLWKSRLQVHLWRPSDWREIEKILR